MKNSLNESQKQWDNTPANNSQMPNKPLTLYRAYQSSLTGRSKLGYIMHSTR